MTSTFVEVDQFLRGEVAFPHLDDWIADGALYAHQTLSRFVADGSVAADVHADLARLDPSTWTRPMLHPATFAFVATRGASFGLSWHDVTSYWTMHDAAIGRPVLLDRSPGPVFDDLLRGLGRGSRHATCEAANYLVADDPRFLRASDRCREAMDVLATIAPGFHSELRSLVEWIGFTDEGASFRGASGVIQRGLILLSPTPSWTPAVFAEELVHETTHCLLDLVSLRRPLLSGEDAMREVHAAPFRPDPRHLFGNFHALVVVARLACLFDLFERHGVEPERNWTALTRDYVERSLDALDAVARYPQLSPLARDLLDLLVRPVFSAVQARRGVDRSRSQPSARPG